MQISEFTRRDFLAGALGTSGTGVVHARGKTKLRVSCLPVSFFDAISHGQMSLGEWFDFAAELGLDGTECGPLLVEPLGPAPPAEFARMADLRGLPVSNYTAYSDFTHPDAEVREREVTRMLRNIEIAKELGAPSLRALTGQQRPGVSQPEGIAWAVEGIRRVAEAAHKARIQVNVENHTKAFTWSSFDFAIKGDVFLKVLEGLRDAPVGVQFDIANPMVAEEDPLELYDRIKSRVRYVHLNDVRRTGSFEFVTVGTGLAPIPELLRRLYQNHYAGWVSIEEQSRTGKDGFREAVRYTRQALENAQSASS